MKMYCCIPAQSHGKCVLKATNDVSSAGAGPISLKSASVITGKWVKQHKTLKL